MKTLYVSDLDGTLLQPDAQLSQRTVTLLNESIAAGKLFTVATARTPATVSPIIAPLNMTLPAVVMTGAALWDSRRNVYDRVKHMTPEAAANVVKVCRETKTPIFMYTLVDNLIHIYHIGGMSPLEQTFLDERSHTPFKTLETDRNGVCTLPDPLRDVILFYGMQPDAISHRAYEEMVKLEGVRPQFYHDIYGETIGIIEAFSSEATKAKAVRALADRIGADRIVAFGDNINDLPMMREADLAVAVGNARDEVKEAADIVIGPNTEDSVAKFIAEE
jgi:hypothetical protein